MKPFRLAIFASGSGSNAVAICKFFSMHPQIEVALILSNNEQAGVLQRAHELGIESITFSKKDFVEGGRVDTVLQENQITHLVLAGFLWLVPSFLIAHYPSKIINIHPALLPKYGGKGMYGARVHETVRNSGDTETGITIHLVNEHFDDGKPLLQVTCSITASDSVVDIAAKVQVLEHIHYPKTIESWVLSDSNLSH
jgi:phosphoribosylglycinamide formyltransferase-1